jgi:hypothetical protein
MQFLRLPLWRRAIRNAPIRIIRVPHGLLVICVLIGPVLRAQENSDEVRSLARNPVADAIKVPFGVSINFDTGPYRRTSNSLQIQPVIPVPLSEHWLLVPRIVATAITYIPNLAQNTGGSTGLGDTIATFFVTPARAGKLIWGIGPSLLIPTATNGNLGGGKWDLGPSVVLLAEPKWGSAGVLVQNIWSLPGNSHRSSVNQIQIETSLSCNLPHDWYLVTAPTLNSDWTQATGQRWLVPLGGGAGRTFSIWRQAVDSNVTLYYNAIRPSGQLSPEWQMSLQFTLIYPKERKSTLN